MKASFTIAKEVFLKTPVPYIAIKIIALNTD